MMLVSSRNIGLLLLATACTGALADDGEEMADMEFLEYLGSWEASDEEWLLLNEPLAAAESDDAPIEDGHSGESENDDEG